MNRTSIIIIAIAGLGLDFSKVVFNMVHVIIPFIHVKKMAATLDLFERADQH